MNIYLSNPCDVSIDHGWAPLGTTGLEVTRLPLLDTRTQLRARLDYRSAGPVLESFGARLPTRDELLVLLEVGLHLPPVILPDSYLRGLAPGRSDDALRAEAMASLEWARHHDERAQSFLDAASWDGDVPVWGWGKQWIAGAPPGRAWLCGWFLDGHLIQSGIEAPGSPGPHNDLHVDYSMCTYGVRPAA